MKLSIIIVSYNTKDLTLQTIASIAASLNTDSQLKKSTEVFVVDNASKDDSVSALKKYSKTVDFPIKVIENQQNLGFAHANNIGIQQAKGEYYLLLNSDTIISPKSLPRLIAVFDTHPPKQTTAPTSHSSSEDALGIIAPALVYPDGRPQPQGGNLPSLATLFFHMTLLDDLPLIGQFLPSTQHTGKRTQSGKYLQKEWVAGTAMLIRREVISEIGLLDENIFMYGEDIELCLRAKNHNWDIAEVPSVTITHLQSASSTPENAIRGELKGYVYIWAKHKPSWQQPILKLLLQLGVGLRAMLFAIIEPGGKRHHLYSKLVQEVKNW